MTNTVICGKHKTADLSSTKAKFVYSNWKTFRFLIYDCQAHVDEVNATECDTLHRERLSKYLKVINVNIYTFI